MANILIVDDQHDLIVLVKLCLNARGHNTEGANSKPSLMNMLTKFKPDLIILDVMLGRDDGRLICKELKESEYMDIPILLYSASILMLDHFKEYNADDKLEKPFDVSELQMKVEAMLNKSKTQ